MYARLTFNLENPNHKRAHNRCIKSEDMALFIWELDQLKMPEDLREKYLELLDKHKIDLEDLII